MTFNPQCDFSNSKTSQLLASYARRYQTSNLCFVTPEDILVFGFQAFFLEGFENVDMFKYLYGIFPHKRYVLVHIKTIP